MQRREVNKRDSELSVSQAVARCRPAPNGQRVRVLYSHGNSVG